MFIESVELHNIKSYDGQGCCIEFRPGVNLILGENGSGKTTILEAIGYCLFDALSYKLEQFIREGNSEGLAKLTFKHHDERRYAVVRDIKKTSGLIIQDVDSGRYLYTKRKDAENWLSDQLGVEFGKYGKELFQNAIGVAQGKMTGSFIVSPAARKKIFDPILRVDEYEQAFKKLAETKRKLDALLRKEEIEQSRLKGRLEKLPIVKERFESLVEQIGDGKMKLEMSQDQLEALETELSGLDELLESRNKLESQLSAAKQQLNNLEEQIQISEKAWQEAMLASKTVELCEPGYKRHVQAGDDIKQLEARREERDQLNRKFQDIEQELSGVNQQLLGLEDALAEVTKAEQRIAELEPLVQRQDNLEAHLQEAKQRVEERRRLLREIEKSQSQISGMNNRLKELRAQIAHRADLENDLQEYTTRRNDLLVRMEDLTEKINVNLTNREARNKEHQEARLDLQAWEAAIRQRDELATTMERDQEDLLEMERRIRERQDLIVEYEKLERHHQTRLDHRTEIQQQIARCQQRLTELRDHLNLLMGAESAECPVCRRPLSEHELEEVETEFKDEEKKWSTTLNETETDLRNAANEIKEIEKRLKTIQTSLTELPVESQAAVLRAAIEEKKRKVRDLQIQIDRLSESPNKVEALQITISQLTVEFQTLTEQQSAVQDERNQLDQKISRLNEDIGNLPSPVQLTDLVAEIQRISNEKDQQEVEAGELVNTTEELQNLEQVLDRLGDPRKEQNQFVGIASRRAALEMDYQAAQNRKAELTPQREDLIQALETFTSLDQKFEEKKLAIRENEEDHRKYLENYQIAETLPERKLRLDSLQQQKTDQIETIERLQNEEKQVLAIYNSTYHGTVRKDYEQARTNVTTISTQIIEWQNQKQAIEGELAEFEEQELQLKATDEQVDRLTKLNSVFDFVRNGIKRASPDIVQRRVKVISHTADKIFQDILDDLMLTLNWDETYAISVSSGQQERIFDQLSGGEQMAASIAVRLALLLHMSDNNLRWLFLDEPTANLDDKRRDKLADRITRLDQLDQIFVITHDDTFERDTHHLIPITKRDGVSTVDIRN